MDDKLPEKEVLVKLSTCKKCTKTVRVAVLHMMDARSMKEFEEEVEKYNLQVSNIPLLEYKDIIPEFCDCIDLSHLQIELTKDNIKEWLAVLDSISMHLVGPNEKLSAVWSEHDWLEWYEGCTPLEALEDEEWEQGQN